jgi:hypothetical protein
MKKIYVITGGTMVHVSPHFSLCAPAYGNVGLNIYRQLSKRIAFQKLENRYKTYLVKTKMAGENSKVTKAHLEELGVTFSPETNQDLQTLIHELVNHEETIGVVMSAAICDFEPVELMVSGDMGIVKITKFGKNQKRLHHVKSLALQMQPSDKIIDLIKGKRPDIFLVTFKTTAGATENELFSQASDNMRRSKSDLVFANDIHKHLNMVVTPSGEKKIGKNRHLTVNILCDEFLNSILK